MVSYNVLSRSELLVILAAISESETVMSLLDEKEEWVKVLCVRMDAAYQSLCREEGATVLTSCYKKLYNRLNVDHD